MRTSFAMMALKVTSPIEDEGAEVDGAVEAGGVIVSIWGRLGLSWKGYKKMAKKPRDSGRKNELITSHRILIDIYKG